MRAGVSAGDELLAVDGWRIRRLDEAQQWLEPGQAFELLLARDQRVLRVRVATRGAKAAPQITLVPATSAPPRAVARRRAWIGA
jgi:predicted metalloprotease with PDZ domain